MGIGNRIKAIAKDKGISLRSLAAKADVSYNTLYSIVKRDSDRADPETIRKIASALNVTVASLFGMKYESQWEVIPGRLRITESNDSDGNRIKYTIDATDPEAHAIGLQIFDSLGVSITNRTPQIRVLDAFSRLNEKGQQVAVERVEELTKIPDYQKTETPADGD